MTNVIIKPAAPSKKRTRAASTVNLDGPGRLRVKDMLALLRVSRTTLYRGISTGRYPAPDGHDATLPYWRTATVRRFLDEGPT